MKLNWSIRAKNPWFWIGLIGVIFAPVLASMGIADTDLTSWASVLDVLKQFVSTPYLIGVAVTSVLSFLGVTTDPTRKGLADSDNAMTYTELN